jgi:hypothetical protein
MQSFANIFLILFLNAAGLGIADSLLSEQFAISWLSAFVDFAEGMTIFFAFGIYIGFALNQHLPKKVLVPPLLMVLWSLFDYFPLENLAGDFYRPLALLAQILIGVLALQLNLSHNKRSRLFVPGQFSGPAFSSQNLFRYCLVNIFILPLVAFALVFATVSDLIEEQSAGFMRLKADGLYMVEKAYQRGDKTIHLASMIHLGQPEYFSQISAALQGKQALLLAEGVTDKQGLLRGDFSYQKIAELLGLAAQEQMQIEGRLINAQSLERLNDKIPGKTDILPADIDLAEFDQQTITLLNALGENLLNNESVVEGFQQFNQWAKANTTAETNQLVMNDLVEKRNKVLLSYLPKALRKYDTLIIPWGALHMPGLARAIEHKGFTLASQQERLSIDFLRLPYERIWESSLN